MQNGQQPAEKKREFWLSSLALNNKTSVFLLTGIIVIFGLISYIGMSREQFPEVVIPTAYINTIYPGNSPTDIENLITRPLEKELKSIDGMKKMTSTSSQDVSVIIMEFEETVDISEALTDIKDGIDKAKRELPTDLDDDPVAQEIDVSEMPIMTINISGDYDLEKLKEYAEWLEDEIEEFKEVSKVDISGSVEREIQVNANSYQMAARRITFNDIEQAIANENIAMGGGDILTEGFRRSLRVDAEFEDAKEISTIIVKAEDGNIIYLNDVAQVNDTYEERDSYARMATGDDLSKSNPVLSLRVVKKSGENLIDADKKVNELLERVHGNQLPAALNISITENQADQMKMQIANLENSIISGVILVVLVLLLFMGLRNALFVGIAIPMSIFMSFIILSFLGETVNMMVLFSLILALGMLVDNAIVVIENIYRLREQGMPLFQAAKEGVGEVAVPIISSTLTTLMAFLPLAFWGGMIGEFMKVLPITLIIVLASSLFVGLVINPVVTQTFMKIDKGSQQPARKKRNLAIMAAVFAVFAVIFYIAADTYTVGNLFAIAAILTLFNAFIFRPLVLLVSA